MYQNSSEYVVPNNYTSQVGDHSTHNHHDNKPLHDTIYNDIAKICTASSLKNLKYLEIGCGSGVLLSYFRELTELAVGVEPGEWGKVETGIFPSLDAIPKELYDIIVLYDVLEHVYDPISLLKEIKQYANRNTVLYITFPNKDSMKAMLQKKKWHMVRPFGHIHYFSRASIQTMLHRSGWTLESATATRTSQKTTLDLLCEFSVSQPNVVYRFFKSLLLGQILLGKDQWKVLATNKNLT
jgi:SAM-dependent methyltransferase